MAAVTSNFKGGDKLAAALAELRKNADRAHGVRVGFLAGATYPASARRHLRSAKRLNLNARDRARLARHAASTADLSVAQVAFWNEFGTRNQVPRPFFRRMLATEMPTLGDKIGKIMKAVKLDARRTMALVGLYLKDQLVKSIYDFITPPLKKSTIARKGFSKPLIDSAVMARAPGYELI